MKRLLFFILCLAAVMPAAHAAEDTGSPSVSSTAGGISISPDGGAITSGQVLTVSFPTPMVSADRIEMGGQAPPIVAKPAVDGTFLWKSQTEGELTIASVVAGATHHFTLAPGLKDATGAPVSVADWAVDFTTEPFSLSSDFEFTKHLAAQPRVPVSSNYLVLLTEVAQHAWFQDRDSRQRLPAEVIQTDDGPPEGTQFQVQPREPLPAGHTYDLLIEGLRESKSHQPLTYPEVFPLGDTHDLKVEWAAGFNAALATPEIIIKFNDTIPPDALKDGMVQITPDLPGFEAVADGDKVTIDGTFDFSQRYHISVSKALRGARGYALPADSHWTASIPPRQPSIAFPGPNIYLRSTPELHFTFVQSHTPAATWKLAAIPLEKLPAVSKRLQEYELPAQDPLTGGTIPDPKTGDDKQRQTELLVKAFDLQVVATGTCPATQSEGDETRNVKAASPSGAPLSGPYLIEASSTLPDGRIAGGRALILFSDYILTQKRSPDQAFVRVAGMKDAMPVQGITVRAVTDQNIEMSRATTDANGMATFNLSSLFPSKREPAYLFIADTAEGPALEYVDGETYGRSYSGRGGPRDVAMIITDRNLYRPGEEVEMKGLLKVRNANGVVNPRSGKAHWEIHEGDQDKVIGEGDATSSEEGSFEASWKIPRDVAVGDCTLHVTLDGGEYTNMGAGFAIQEYRVPLFSAEVQASTEVGTTAHARVSSMFFHGGPNAGARVHWKAEWTAVAESGSDTRRYNAWSEIGPALNADNELNQTVENDARLDANGQAVIACESPFNANAAVGISSIRWHAEITSIDGQTLAGGTDVSFSSAPVILGVTADEQPAPKQGIAVKVETVDAERNAISKPVRVGADLYCETARTVKEQVAPLVYRYRNNTEYAKVESVTGTAPGSLEFSATTTGNYVVAVRALDIKTPLVSEEVAVTGNEAVDVPVDNDTSFPLTTRQEPWLPGEKAVFTVEAPFRGVAWVCVETDKILDTMLIPLAGNMARIEIPVKKEYAPNATVSVYLTKPGGPSGLPVERFATAPLVVSRPDWQLKLTAHLDQTEVRPGQRVHGEFLVMSEGKPVASADLAVFAVDDAVLKLGDWELPDPLAAFYPANPYAITNYQSLASYVEMDGTSGDFQKGFIIGDGGDENAGNITNLRKEFRTLAYWQGSVKSDAMGRVPFDFPAPDNLTSYRIVAVGQTDDGRFGADGTATVKVNKPLMVEPALPRFLRDGDEVELRAVVRQSFTDSTGVKARCAVEGGCALDGAPTLSGTAAKNAPWVLRFRAHLADHELTPIRVRFEASAISDPAMSDAVEVTIPVSAPTIVRHESVAGTFTGPRFDARGLMPVDWTKGTGQYAVTLSTSSWVPAIAGIPTILDYPHGCFEQITSKLLCYSLLANLMDYLPGTEARLNIYHDIFQRGIGQINGSLLPDGRLPYWPGDPVGDDFVTCQACWALNEAAHAGFTIPEDLSDKLAKGVTSIAGRSGDADTRAFALFVLASLKGGDDLTATGEDIYLHRGPMGQDGRALLAMALQQLNIMQTEKLQLMAEIDKAIMPTAFKPSTFGSMDRTEGICAMAFETIAPPNFTAVKKEEIHKRLLHIMDSSSLLSTQENLWLLLAFKAALGAEASPPLLAAQPPASLTSRNGDSAAWTERKLDESLALTGLNQTALTFLMHSDFSLSQLDVPRVDRGFRVERVVRDLNDPKRMGTAEAPYRIGDQLLVTYRVYSQNQQYYVALEDSLPAAFETVNPDLAQIGKFFELPPPGPNDKLLEMSHSELRDRSTLLYFDDVPPGPGVYSILTRVTAAGKFRWPQTQIVPMYDSRFSGLSASSLCVVSAE